MAKTIMYLNMCFEFHPKMVNGFYFTHIKSGDGIYNTFNAETFGKPRKNNAESCLAAFIESSNVRKDIINQYREKYGE